MCVYRIIPLFSRQIYVERNKHSSMQKYFFYNVRVLDHIKSIDVCRKGKTLDLYFNNKIQ